MANRSNGSLAGSGRVSLTARAIAAGRGVGYRHLHDPLVAQFLPATERRAVQRTRAVASRGPGADAVALATAGLTRHAALRMDAIDRVTRSAVASGMAQVVIVGAGFDTRAWRLADLAECTVWELDLPGTQQFKRRGIGSGQGATSTAAAVHFVEVDLSATTIPDALADTDHVAGRPTLWIWEAVAPYLRPEAVTATLGGMRQSSAPGSQLAMTFFNANPGGMWSLLPLGGRALLSSRGFGAMGEPILSTYDGWEICGALEAAGFCDPAISDSVEWARDAGLPPRPNALRVEMLATASV